jgi:hypothetical protein
VITKEKDEMVLRVPLTQNSYDAVGELIGEVPNLIGVAGKEFSISYLIDLGYKGDQQEGSPIVAFDDRDGLEEACKILGLDVWEHSICDYCGETIYGTYTLKDKGNMCYSCRLKDGN